MKRINQEGDADQDINAMANCLMLLSGSVNGVVVDGDSTRVFTCKTCDRQFPSFQALGGHRASHKKPRLMAVDHLLHPFSPPKPKIHECPICGLEFAIGQALGGHMRRHRATVDDQNRPPQRVPVVKKARVLFLDLNLTPLENKFVFGNIVPTVDCLF